jgi:hypothetical protein
MLPLPSGQTAIFDISHLLGIPAPKHLLYQSIIIASIVARIDAFKAVPVFGKNLLEDAPSQGRCCSHQVASLRSVGLSVIALFYHIPSMTSTPSSAFPIISLSWRPSPPRSPLRHGDFRAIAKWKFLDDQENNTTWNMRGCFDVP